MTEGKLTKYAAACVLTAFGALALWLGLRYLLPALLPVFVGYGLAALVRSLGRWAAAHTGDFRLPPVGEKLGGMVLAAGVCILVFWGGCKGLAALGGQAGDLVQRAAGLWDWDALPPWLRDSVPPALREKIGLAVTGLVEKGAGWLAGAAGTMLSALPRMALALFITVASVFYWLSDKEGILASAASLLPAPWRNRIRDHPLGQKIRAGLAGMLGGAGAYLRAQLSVSSVVFLVLLAGLSLLQVHGSAAWALLIALADLLPLLGAGAVLLPWAAFALLSGRTGLGVGLAVLWLVLWLIRQWLEPHLVGKALGTHPYIMLAGLYVSYRLAGVPGMVVGAVVLGSMHPSERTGGTA